jgi:hypothetical protein
MHTGSSTPYTKDGHTTESTTLTTTLYELIAAVQSAVEPGEEALVVPIVAHLLRAAGATWQAPSTPELQ